MQGYWCQFAKTGNPNAGNPNTEGLPHWPVFEDGRPTMLQLVPEPECIGIPRHAQLSLLI
jgi:para-nitrobenzyl esterase